MYKRPEDEYSIAQAPAMIEQLKREAEEKLIKNRCKFTTVKSYQKIEFSGHPHVGVLNHFCSLQKGHENECECLCGMKFKGFSYEKL